jgi:hypothetical protein
MAVPKQSLGTSEAGNGNWAGELAKPRKLEAKTAISVEQNHHPKRQRPHIRPGNSVRLNYVFESDWFFI